MEFYTSYFYQIRFFEPRMIPLSTACSDPKWYHNGGKTYFDKRGVLNGLRAEYLHPDDSCCNLCHGAPCEFTPNNCEFLRAYRTQLEKVNFPSFILDCGDVISQIKNLSNFVGEPAIVLIVHEPPSRACSERAALQDWIRSKGYQCDELYF